MESNDKEKEPIEVSVRRQIIKDLHTQKQGLSYSTLKNFTSPINLVNYLVEKKTKVKPKSEGMLFGSACDAWLLSADEIDDMFVFTDAIPSTDHQINFVSGVINLIKHEAELLLEEDADVVLGNIELNEEQLQDIYRSFYSKGTYDKLYASLKDYIYAVIDKKEVIPMAIRNESEDMIGRLKRQPDVEDLLSQISEVQKKLTWTYEGWKHTGFIDAFLGEPDFFDAKYTKDSNPDKFERDIFNMKYYLQSGMYAWGLMEAGYVMPQSKILAYDRTGNHSIIEIEPNYIKYGIREYKYLIQSLNKALQNNSFGMSYGFFKNHFSVGKPRWAKGFALEGEDYYEEDEQ